MWLCNILSYYQCNVKFYIHVHKFVQYHIQFSNMKKSMCIVRGYMLKMSMFKVYLVLLAIVSSFKETISLAAHSF